MRCASFFVVLVLATRHLPLATSLISQRHERVNGAEQNQCERKRNMQQQPAMQPVVQTFLAPKLARFVANVFKVRERGLRGRRKQSTQSGERAACFRSIGEVLAALPRLLQKRTHFAQVKSAKRHALLFT